MKLDTPGWIMLAVVAFLLYQKYGAAAQGTAPSTGGALPNPNATGATGSQGLDLSVSDGWNDNP